jgi:hypothetical protein
MSIPEQLFATFGGWIIIGLTIYYIGYIHLIKQYKKNKRFNETFNDYLSNKDRHDTLILFAIFPPLPICYGVVVFFEYINKRIRNHFNV